MFNTKILLLYEIIFQNSVEKVYRWINREHLGVLKEKNLRAGSFSFLRAFFLFLTKEKEKSETMFFLHPDHLGSIMMITDGYGNVTSGGNNGGKSSINYKPYGEINRTDSSGPDISKFKYTGQEEDKESGLLYYKARYYDPAIGRFLQADSVVMPESTYGMNRYMYVEGRPVNFTDRSGNRLSSNAGWALMAYLTHSHTNFGETADQAAIAGWAVGHNRKKSLAKKERHKRNEDIGHAIIGVLAPTTGYPRYELHRRHGSRTALKRNLDDDVKLAAIGYMSSGEEGAKWGYLYGTLRNSQKYLQRKENYANIVKGEIIIYSAIAGAVGFSGSSSMATQFENARILKTSLDALLGAVYGGLFVDALLTEGFESTLEAEKYQRGAEEICAISFGLRVAGKESNTFIDQLCIFQAGQRNERK